MAKDPAQAKNSKPKASATDKAEVPRSASHTHLQASKAKSSPSKRPKSQQALSRGQSEDGYVGSYHPESHRPESQIHPLFAQLKSTTAAPPTPAPAYLPRPKSEPRDPPPQPRQQVTSIQPHAYLPQPELNPRDPPPRPPPRVRQLVTGRPFLSTPTNVWPSSRRPIRDEKLRDVICQNQDVSPDIAELMILCMVQSGALKPFTGYVMVDDEVRGLVLEFEEWGGDRW